MSRRRGCVRRCRGEKGCNGDAADTFAHAVAPVGAPSVYCCGGSEARIAAAAPRRLREATRSRNRTATRLLRCHTRWRPWGRQAFIAAAEREACIAAEEPKSLREATWRRKRLATRLLRCRTRWRPWERQARQRRFFYGEWQGYSKSCCCAEQCRFRKGQAARRDSVARRATFDNWRLAAEQGSEMAWSVITDVAS